jgi:hypothetical protein
VAPHEIATERFVVLASIVPNATKYAGGFVRAAEIVDNRVVRDLFGHCRP